MFVVPHLPEARPAHVSLYLVLRLMRLRWLRGARVSDWLTCFLCERPMPVTRTLQDVLRAFVAASFPTPTHSGAAPRRAQRHNLQQSLLDSVFDEFAQDLHCADKPHTRQLFSAGLCMQYLLLHNARARSLGVGRQYNTDQVPVRAIVKGLARLPVPQQSSDNCISPHDFVSSLVGLVMQHCPHALHTSVMATSRAGWFARQLRGDSTSRQLLPLIEKFSARHKQTPSVHMRSLLDAVLLVKPAVVQPDDLLRVLALASAPTAALIWESKAVVLQLGVRRLLLDASTTTAAAAVVGQLWFRVLREHPFPLRWQLDTATVMLQSGALGPGDAAQTLSWGHLTRQPTLLLQQREAGWLTRHPVVLQIVLCIIETLVVRVTVQSLKICDTEGAADVVAVCGSMLAHRLLDLLRPLTDELEVAADLCKSSLCCFLNWIFEGYPKVLEAVHLQRYAEPLVSVLVREVDALRGCLHLMEQLLGRMAPPSTRGFEFLLAVELVSVERDRQLRVW